MKTAFNTNQVAHVWANRCQPYGSGGSMSFNSDGLYSYSLLIGKFISRPTDDTRGIVLIHDTSNSPTTNRHVSYAYDAVQGLPGYDMVWVPYIEATVTGCIAALETRAFGKLADVAKMRSAYIANDALAEASTDLRGAAKLWNHLPKADRPKANPARHIEKIEELSRALPEATSENYLKLLGTPDGKAWKASIVAYLDQWNDASTAAKFDAEVALILQRDDAEAVRYMHGLAHRDPMSAKLKAKAKRLLRKLIKERGIGAEADAYDRLQSVEMSVTHYYSDQTITAAMSTLRALGLHETDKAKAADRAARYAVAKYKVWQAKTAGYTGSDELRGEVAEWPELVEQVKTIEARYLQSQAEQIAKWRAGVPVRVSYGVPTMLRLARDDGKRIETSRGAEVPVRVAKGLWELVAKARANLLTDKDLAACREVGPFRLDSVALDGSLSIGCHRISYEELAHMAVLLGLSSAEEVNLNQDSGETV